MIGKRGTSGSMIMIVGVIVISALVVLVLFDKTFDLLGLLETEDKIDEDKYVTQLDRFLGVIDGLLRDRERTFDQSDIFLEEGVTFLFFDKGYDKIVGFADGSKEHDAYIYAHKPIGAGCSEDRSCACMCSRLSLISYSRPDIDAGDEVNTVFEFGCEKVLSCKPLYVNKFINEDKHGFTLEKSQLWYEQDIRYSFLMSFQEGFFLVGAYGDYFDIEEDTPIMNYKGIFVPKKEQGFWPWDIGPREQVAAGFVYLEKKGNDLGICAELPCFGEG
ncbi:MAG: hypothetical protein ABIB47_05855 [Candidatus Woesearchaeota archaeon]